MQCVDFLVAKFAVIGLGETGLSIIKYLRYRNANIVKIMDTRDNLLIAGELHEYLNDLPVYCGTLKVALFDDVDVIVISPGVSIYEEALIIAQKKGKLVLGDVELFAQAIKTWSSKIVGITGSNGKTTVATLMHYITQGLGVNTLLAGNIGVPVLNSLIAYEERNEEPELIILELSSFQLETTYSLDLKVATVLNISEDHLDRYRDLLEYAYNKANIFSNCQIQLLNYDDALVRAMRRQDKQQMWLAWDKLKGQEVFYLQRNGQYYDLIVDGKKIIGSEQLQLVGVHNYFNCLATLALLRAVAIDVYDSSVLSLLGSFAGVSHRMQKILVHEGVTFIEDSKGTNIGAVIAGISGLDYPVHLILGGDGKGQDFSLLTNLVATHCKSVALIGQDKEKIYEVLRGLKIKIKICESLKEATQFCINNALRGEAVVLSPACASWDMFDNYKHRAQVFKDSIYEIIG